MRTIQTFIRNHSPFLRSRGLVVLLMVVSLASLDAGSGLVVARSPRHRSAIVPQLNSIPMLTGTFQTVSAGAGDQTDPRVYCNVATYTNRDSFGGGWIRYFDFSTNTDYGTPGNGLDYVSSINGRLIAFTEVNPNGNNIALFNTATQFRTDLPGDAASKPALGGDLVAFEDRSFSIYPNLSEILVYDRNTEVTTRLTEDQLFDKTVDVSPTGNVVVWEKCQPSGFGCHIYCAIQTAPDVFSIRALTGAPGDERDPRTNGQVVVYTSDRSGLSHVYFQPIGGGSETEIIMPGNQIYPSISGNLITFESQVGSEYDIFVYDITTGSIYQVTNTPFNEALANISVCNGVGRIVYAAGATDFDLYAFTFQLSSLAVDQINNLIALVRSFGLPRRTESSLITPLQDALAAIAASDTATACSSLTTFINLAQSQSGKKLTPAQASQLIDAANRTKATLGCP